MAKKTETTTYLEYILAKIFIGVVKILPFWLALRLGNFLGKLAFKLWSKRRQITLDNLEESFKNKTKNEISRIAQQVWSNIGKTLVEFIYLEKWSKNALLKRVILVGKENLDKALSKNKGVIFLVAHFGNWELVGVALTAMGYQISVIARPLDNKLLDKIVTRIRSLYGEEIMANINPTKYIFKALQQNKIVAILMDQNLYKGGIFVDFFARPAATTPIISLLALRTNAAVIPIHSLRLPDGKHKIIIEPEVNLVRDIKFEEMRFKCDNSDKQETIDNSLASKVAKRRPISNGVNMVIDVLDKDEIIRKNTGILTKIIENWIKKNPAEWFWVHNRWKTQPSKNSN